MKNRFLRTAASLFLAGAMIVAPLGSSSFDVQAEEVSGLSIRESEIHQLLTEDLELPDSIDGQEGAVITYSVDEKDSDYAEIEGNVLKITRPYAKEGNYSFTLHAKIEYNGETTIKDFPLIIAEGVSDDTYAGYIYVSFSVNKDNLEDVQQTHFFLSEDGLNWTALNGCNPAFLAGTDYASNIERVSTSKNTSKNNWEYKTGTDITKTVSGDASVLFPFEGEDQGVRDQYLIRGCKADGSDSGKIWLLATDLNTHDDKYYGDKASDKLGDWGLTSINGSTSIFIWETEDWVHWTRRWVDVGSEVGAGMAWAPEAIYNPAKDNYLVYWSARVEEDGKARDRLYCNETSDFINFGPTKLYEAEPYYKNYNGGVSGNDGYGNIDTSQLWVPEKDENGETILNEDGSVKNPYGTLYRLVKDETNNHVELMSAETVLDPAVDYDASDPLLIKPYTLDGVTYDSLDSLKNLTNDSNAIKLAEIVHNWFIGNSTGNHFTKISQTGIENYKGQYEGATMFKFNDRDEWCVMIDYYGDMSVRYEPYLTTDLSVPDSIKKAATGTYGRTGGDIGTHGGMIPITAEEYNTLVSTYNADPTVDNYHPIDYIEVDKRALSDRLELLEEKLNDENLSEEQAASLKAKVIRAKALIGDDAVSSSEIDAFMTFVDEMFAPVQITVSKTEVTLTAGNSETITAEVTLEDTELTWKSADETVATVENGIIKAVSKGSTFVFVKAGMKGLVPIKVTVQ